MNPMFKSSASTATSSDVESHFASLKKYIVPRKLLSAPHFLEAHIDFINAEIKLNAMSNADVSNSKRKRTNSFHEKSPIAQGMLFLLTIC